MRPDYPAILANRDPITRATILAAWLVSGASGLLLSLHVEVAYLPVGLFLAPNLTAWLVVTDHLLGLIEEEEERRRRGDAG